MSLQSGVGVTLTADTSGRTKENARLMLPSGSPRMSVVGRQSDLLATSRTLRICAALQFGELFRLPWRARVPIGRRSMVTWRPAHSHSEMHRARRSSTVVVTKMLNLVTRNTHFYGEWYLFSYCGVLCSTFGPKNENPLSDRPLLPLRKL